MRASCGLLTNKCSLLTKKVDLLEKETVQKEITLEKEKASSHSLTKKVDLLEKERIQFCEEKEAKLEEARANCSRITREMEVVSGEVQRSQHYRYAKGLSVLVGLLIGIFLQYLFPAILSNLFYQL